MAERFVSCERRNRRNGVDLLGMYLDVAIVFMMEMSKTSCSFLDFATVHHLLMYSWTYLAFQPNV